MDRYAVVGKPVAHSKSPEIHALFARQTGEALRYEAVEVAAERFDAFVREFFATGGAGLNITLPHKEQARRLAGRLEPRAQLAGAVNTLYLDEAGRLCGDNTDGPGLVRDLENNHGLGIAGKKLLLLGAGGAVRGALAALVVGAPASITVVNRTLERAERLRHDFRETADITVTNYEGLRGRYELLINGTSLGLSGETPPITADHLAADACCYDMMYGDTAFTAWAKAHGAALALDGLGMLVEQAAESFLRWRGVRPDTAPVIRALRGR